MLKSILTPALLSLALAGSAFAGAPVADTQAALAEGVQPGQYTAAEVQAINDARTENDAAKLNYYLTGANRAEANAAATIGSAQLAAIAGVAPGHYTVAELQQIIDAKKDNDAARLNFILSGANRGGPVGTSDVTPGKAQLAAIAGLDPATHTVAELVAASNHNED